MNRYVAEVQITLTLEVESAPPPVETMSRAATR